MYGGADVFTYAASPFLYEYIPVTGAWNFLVGGLVVFFSFFFTLIPDPS